MIGNRLPTFLAACLAISADTTTPFKGAQLFHDAMIRAGNRSELVRVEGEQHTYMFKDKALYQETIQLMDTFLSSLGFISRQFSQGEAGRGVIYFGSEKRRPTA